MTELIKPEAVVELDRVHHQRFAFPEPDGMPIPSRAEVFGMRAAIHEDLAVTVDVSFIQDEIVRGRLNHAPGIGRTSRDTERQAIGLRVILRLACFEQLFSPRRHYYGIARFEGLGNIAGIAAAAHPDTGKIGRAIGQMRRWTGHHRRLPEDT